MDRPLTRTFGEAQAKRLAALGLRTVGDLLRHYPRRYAPPGQLTDLASLVDGEHVTVVAEVVSGTIRPTKTGTALMEAFVTDGTALLKLTFFGKNRGSLRRYEASLLPGRRGLFTGEVSRFNGKQQLTHPAFVLFDEEDDEAKIERAGWPIPIYPASKSVESWRVGRAARHVLADMTETVVPDPLPPSVRATYHLPTLVEALRLVHEPHEEADWHRGRHRLRFEEAFVLQAELARRRARAAGQAAVRRPGRSGGLLDAFDARLPFTLTAGQRQVGDQVAHELALPHPMQRLLQGEVGSGKTVVALRAMLQVIDSGGQAALLAPTEVLAAQHVRTLRSLLGDLADGGFLGGAEQATRVALLTGSLPAAARREALADAAGGAAGIVVGTHALLNPDVQFADLGLVVVDEQHRFGVEQRDVLRTRAEIHPHLLVMTATPIPRTVAMTVFGDLETSVLREVPAGRSGVRTFMADAGRPKYVARTWALVREQVDAGGRAFVVCPRISADDDGRGADDADLLADDDGAARRPLRAVLEVADELRDRPELAGVPVGVLHGRLSSEDKESALASFAAGDTPVLVTTTVIEVGVDVPAATAMVVLDADRFGLSQLHQLRGRVGRGSAPGVCLLVSHAVEGTPAWTRLETLVATSDGFALAAADLELRREGDVLGAAQSGAGSSLRLLRVTRDADLIEQARGEATALVAQDPELAGWPALTEAIDQRLAGTGEEFIDRV
ncbi:MAG TPA: ATP-dependent DNA helicase RecG [Cellulomonas sp.]